MSNIGFDRMVQGMNASTGKPLPWASFARFLLQRMADNRLMQVAGSLTFTTMLATVPLLTIALIVISALPMFADYSTRFKVMLLSTLMPEFAGKVLTVYMRQFADNAEKLTAAGILMLSATTLMLMATIERTFNAIWGVARARHWLQQGVIYWVMLTLGPAVLGGGLLFWHNLFRATHLSRTAPLFAGILQSCGSIVLTTLVLALLYRVVPNRHVPARHALWGALITSLLLGVAKLCFGIYIDSIASYKLVYGAFASIPIVLLWVFCMWLVVLAGAVFTCGLSYWEGAAWRRRLNSRRRMLDALRLLIALNDAHHQGVALTLPELRARVPIGFDELGWVLDKLALRGYVQQGQNDTWVLMKSLEAISMAELFDAFVYPADHRRSDPLEQGVDELIDPWLASLAAVKVADFTRRVGH